MCALPISKPRDRRARFRPRRASFWSSRSSLSSEQLPTRKVEHDFLAAAADRVDANLAIDALDLAASDIGCAAQYLRRFAGHRFEHTGRLHLQHRRSEEHTSELQSLMRISYDVFFLKKK